MERNTDYSNRVRRGAERAARAAYLTDSYGNGKRDWQSAVTAAIAYLAAQDITDDDWAIEIASDVAEEIDNPEPDELDELEFVAPREY